MFHDAYRISILDFDVKIHIRLYIKFSVWRKVEMVVIVRRQKHHVNLLSVRVYPHSRTGIMLEVLSPCTSVALYLSIGLIKFVHAEKCYGSTYRLLNYLNNEKCL